MNKIKLVILSIFIGVIFVGTQSCRRSASSTTGWEYNNPKNGGFEVAPFEEQMTGPGLVLIEGGTFVMGQTEQDVMYDWNNRPRRVTVSSFYMDEVEIRNLDYLEYLHWLYRVFVPNDLATVFHKALPDTLVWRNQLAYNEPYVQYYLRHPAYREYPVVGVSWEQASDYCAWRTDRVNEMILVEQGLVSLVPEPSPEEYFSTEAYFVYEDYEGNTDRRLQNIVTGEFRNAKMEDGILLPNYRLPTEAEWEFAALGLIGNTLGERILERRLYPWNGQITRTDDKKFYGDFVANMKRGKGDYMGIAGYLNDAADATAPVYSYWPNDYGLYNMGGNVSEWVMDVYRDLSHEQVSDFRPFRGNVYTTKVIEDVQENIIAERDSIGRIPEVPVSDFKNNRRRNYRQSNNINYIDGDYASIVNTDGRLTWTFEEETSTKMYAADAMNVIEDGEIHTLVTDRARVYKGGSWKDLQYWMGPGQRRYLEQDEATDHIGFRCAMARLGPPIGRGR
ncbi:MAG: gliding motility lipoprotein GldJ [Bacteroidales bacterium]|jgi:gliding motility-associated lipoprotein GldJ|nr:gliding motility lipoprotein GldJ [Bacteroidales bacterium]